MRRALFIAAIAAGCLLGAPAAEADLRVGKNHRLASDPNQARGKDAAGLAVNPRDPRHIVEINADWNVGDCEYTVSLDGGTSWSTAAAFTAPTGFESTCQVGGHLGQAIDRGVAFGSGQNVYATFAAPRSGVLADEGSSVLVAKSTNGGRTFDIAKVALPGGATADPGPNYGLPKLAVDPGVGTGNADRVYVVAGGSVSGQRNTVVTVSNDGGESWSSPVNANAAGQSAVEQSQPVVLADHSVSVAWRSGGSIVVARSEDPPGPEQSAGQTWTSAVAASVPSAVSYPRLAGRENNLYLVYGRQPATPPAGGFQARDHFIDPDMDVYYRRSTDKGATWPTPPQRLNDATPRPGSEITQTRHPDVSVAPNGRVDVVWHDRRHWYRGCTATHNACAEARLGDTYYSFSTDSGATFSPNHRITDRSHNNDVGFDYRFGVYWDFGPVSVPLGNDQLLVAWMDSRDGNFETDTQDIYLARVNHAAPAAVPQETILQSEPASLSVRLSQHTYPGGGENVLAGQFVTRTEGATRVVIVNEDDTAAILAASVLARANLSQVLLSPAGGLPAAVKAEVTRMNPAGAYVIGDEASLSRQVVKDLEDAGVPNDANQIERLDGATPAADAALIAKELDRRTQAQKDASSPAFDAAIVANPASPDASAASALAAARRLPILYVGAGTPLPPETDDALSELDIGKALVIGGSRWVSDAVMAALPDAERLGGADQYATSQAVVAESIERGLPANIAYVADGRRPTEAALLGSAAGRSNGLLLLSRAPLNATAATTAASMELSDDLDRLILVQPLARAPGAGAPTPIRAPGLLAGCSPATASRRPIEGTSAANVIMGTLLGDQILAGEGNDTVDGLAGDDCIDLGPGRDGGQGGLGSDFVVGGAGTDRIGGASGRDRLLGGPDRDRVDGGSHNDRVLGDSGSDLLFGSFGNDVLDGGRGVDRIFGGRGRDRIEGSSGSDRVSAGSSGDRVAGDSGNDRINGNSGNDRLRGNAGRDRITGGAGRDRISGGSGSDRINARDGQRDRIDCGRGRDEVLADRVDYLSRNCERMSRRPARRDQSS